MTSVMAGELYFLGEIDLRSQSMTPFVKIGIVKESQDRDTAKRLKEHQTGNPRRIVEIAIIGTSRVERIETLLHQTFAPVGVGGEWFELGGDRLTDAITHAQNLADSMTGAEETLRLAEGLNDHLSHGEPLKSDESLVAHHRRCLELRAVSKAIDSAQTLVKNALGEAASNGIDVSRFVQVIRREASPAFDKKAFQLAHPEEWMEFQVEYMRADKRFLPARDPSLDLSVERLAPVVARLASEVETTIDSGTSDIDSIAHLHSLSLDLLREGAAIDFEADRVEAELKVACGEAPGIEGICSWKRVMIPDTKLDVKALAEQHPELHQRYLTPKSPVISINVARNRNYVA